MMSLSVSFIQTTHKLDVRDHHWPPNFILQRNTGNACPNRRYSICLIFLWARNMRTKNNTYFCSIKRGSKNSVVILLAYREQPVMEHRPKKHRWVLQSVRGHWHPEAPCLVEVIIYLTIWIRSQPSRQVLLWLFLSLQLWYTSFQRVQRWNRRSPGWPQRSSVLCTPGCSL